MSRRSDELIQRYSDALVAMKQNPHDHSKKSNFHNSKRLLQAYIETLEKESLKRMVDGTNR